MGTDSFFDLVKGPGQSADTYRFRAGSVVVKAAIGSEIFDVSDVAVSYTDNGLPVCALSIPVGTAVGEKSGSGPVNGLYRLQQTFVKFAEVKITVTMVDFQTSADMGNAFKAGTHVIFDGIISSTRVAYDGASSVNLRVRLIHKLVRLASGVPLFSNVVSASGFTDMLHRVLNYNGKGTVPVVPSPKPWTAFINTANVWLESSKLEKLWPQDDPNIRKIVAANTRSTALLDQIVSVAELKLSGKSSAVTQKNILDCMRNILTATRSDMNMMADALRAAQMLYCGIVFTADKGHFIPFDPLWKSSDMKVLRAGMAFTQEYARGSGENYVREGYEITGTVVTAAFGAGYALRFANQLPGYGSWLMPNKNIDDPYALVDQVQFPSFTDLVTAGLSTTRKGEDGTAGFESVGPLLPSLIPQDIKESLNKIFQEEARITTRVLAEDFAYFNTLVKNWGMNSLNIAVALRADVVPGMNIAVNTEVRDQDGNVQAMPVYGMVTKVSNEISVQNSRAVTVIELRYVRGYEEQSGIIDKQSRGNFIWKSAADYLNSLTLWSAA